MRRRACAYSIALIAVVAHGPTEAQSIQRCESQRGTVTYSNGPCPAGTTAVRAVNTAPPVAVTDRKAASARATRDAKQLERLQRERKAEEARAERERLAAEKKGQARARECRRLAARVDEARDAASSATLARRTEAERRLKRAQDQHERDCGT